jgi:hypothetical protein
VCLHPEEGEEAHIVGQTVISEGQAAVMTQYGCTKLTYYDLQLLTIYILFSFSFTSYKIRIHVGSQSGSQDHSNDTKHPDMRIVTLGSGGVILDLDGSSIIMISNWSDRRPKQMEIMICKLSANIYLFKLLGSLKIEANQENEAIIA